jgi:PA14 domain-containing protein
VIARTEPHIDYGTAARLLFPEQTLSSRWTGYYTPQESGSYDIFVQTHRERGGSYRLYVDDKLVLDNWTTLPRSLTTARFASIPSRTRLYWSRPVAGTDGLRASGWELFAQDNLLAATPKNLPPAVRRGGGCGF